jgi:phenylpyruvate tautomerase PptA (4-oxalocrotonate tautomerase family)
MFKKSVVEAACDQYKGNGCEAWFAVSQVNQSHWIWGITSTFLHAVLSGEGFELIHQEELSSLPNENWIWGGYIYEKKRENPKHWSNSRVTPGIFKADW